MMGKPVIKTSNDTTGILYELYTHLFMCEPEPCPALQNRRGDISTPHILDFDVMLVFSASTCTSHQRGRAGTDHRCSVLVMFESNKNTFSPTRKLPKPKVYLVGICRCVVEVPNFLSTNRRAYCNHRTLFAIGKRQGGT